MLDLNCFQLRTPTYCTDLRALQASFELFNDDTHADFIEVKNNISKTQS
jgi:hypothetical protein